MTDSSQKFIARNRAPRVQIEYDVELYGSEKKVQLPFVMGVMSDLAGKSNVPQPAIADRSFLEIDVDNFDDRMRAMAPRAAFSVPNTLTGEGNIPVDLTFQKMEDFSPAAIASKVDSLRPLLEARTQLSNLMAYMDGKAGAETLIEKILADPALLSAVSLAADASADQNAALEGLRALTPEDSEEQDKAGDVLADLKANAPAETSEDDPAGDVLSELSARTVPDQSPADTSADALDGLRNAAPQEVAPDTSTADALAGLSAKAPDPHEDVDTTKNALESLAGADVPEQEEDNTDSLLADLAAKEPEAVEAKDQTAEVLGGLADVEIADEAEDTTDELLAGLAADAPEPAEEPDDTSAVLGSLADTSLPEEAEDTTDDLLADLAAAAPEAVAESDGTADALDSLANVDLPEEVADNSDDLLADLAATAPEDTPDMDTTSDVLDSLAEVDLPAKVEDTTDDLLNDLAAAAPETVAESDGTADALDSLANADLPEEVADNSDDLLADLALSTPESEPEDDNTDALLADMASATPETAVGPDSISDALESLAEVELPPESEDSTDDLLAEMVASAPEKEDDPESVDEALGSLSNVDVPVETGDTTDELLADLAFAAPDTADEPESQTDVLDALAEAELPEAHTDNTDDTDELLAGLVADDAPVDDVDAGGDSDLDELLGDLGGDADSAEDAVTDDAGGSSDLDDLLGDLTADDDAALDGLLTESEDDSKDDLDDLLGDLGGDDGTGLDDLLTDSDAGGSNDSSDLDDLLGGLTGDGDVGQDDALADDEKDDNSDLDDLLGDLGGDGDAALDSLLTESEDDSKDDPDDLLGDLGGDDSAGLDDLLADSDAGGSNDSSDLDDLLGDLAGGGDSDLDDLLGGTDSTETSDLDDLLGDLGGDDDTDLDGLLAGLGDDDVTPGAADQGTEMSEEPEFAYGQMSAERPEPEKLNRKRFRLAILGDFSGRAARGQLETGDSLAARKPILLDPDTAEDVIESFATELVLPIGKDGAGVAVKLGGLDDLHPDELYENVELFGELNGLRGQLSSGATAENAARQLREWGEKHGQHVAPTKARSAGNTVPADLKLSDFQKLIGDTSASLTEPSPLDELMARIVGPHIRAIPNADAMAMKGAVDDALSTAMRLVLHHPEFQSVEGQWRSIDLIARSIETDDTLDVILYDVSAEEIAADLATSDDLAQSGFARLLTEEPLDEEFGRGGYSALIGLYTFEETPPHAELLGRIARVAAHVDAPFIAAITPAFLDTAKEDRHKLVAEAWDTLRAMPEAGHLGLVTPRFMLRRPYGAKSEPIYEFEFEEFTMAEGLKGMLWANPVVLVAILLAKSFRENGASMSLGKIMALGDIPFHFINDQYGDQVALPCTERNVTLDKIEMALMRGFMSVAGIKGRDEIRLTSFGSVAGGEILGPWTGAPPPKPSPPKPEPAVKSTEEVDTDVETGDDIDLDDLLAGFSDDTDDGGDIDDTDAELAALLGDL